jgi:ribosomal protein L37AE/L43A
MDCAKKVKRCPQCRKPIKKRVAALIFQLPDASQLWLWAGGGAGVRGGDGEVIEVLSSDDDE